MNILIKKLLNFKFHNKIFFFKNQRSVKNKYLIFITLIIIFIEIIYDKKKLSDNDLFSEKWMVMIAFNPPKSQIINLLNILEQWKIVIVGNSKKNAIKWKHMDHSKKYIYLSLKDQIKLGYKTIQYLNLNSYSNKNIGYLYAIQHGAKEIYEIDEDLIISKIKNIEMNNDIIDICYGVRNDSLMINPYSYFGENNIWPRGFRLSDIGKENYNNFYNIKSNQLLLKPLVFQGLINGIPDVDSIFIQTRIKKNNIIDDINFSDIYPLIIILLNYFLI